MIATILPSSTNFHAVGYNDRKVAKGVARLIEVKNFDAISTNGKTSTEEKVAYLQAYSAKNRHIQKAQFHVAISCKGREMTEEQLLDFAHQYLKEMGYMEEGQPLLVYAHYDTDNTHLHIVTSRIAPDRRKIQHDHERRRSQQVIDRILGQDRGRKTEKDIEAAKQYTFSSFAQFKAVMLSMGYECYEKKGTVYIKYGGAVRSQFPLSDISTLFAPRYTDRRRARQLRSIFVKYRDICHNKEELQKELKAKFGIDIVFFGRRDAPYGYMIVDHKNKTVIHGSRVLATEQLLDFSTRKERITNIEDYIDKLFELNPKITQGEINKKLWKLQHAYIKKGVLYMNGEETPLHLLIADAINQNNRVEWVEKFSPATIEERDLLCKFYKVYNPERIELSVERPKQHTDAVSRLRELFDDKSIENLRDAVREDGYVIREEQDATYAIDFHRHIIVNLNAEGFDVKRVQWQRKQKPQKRQQPSPKKPIVSIPRVPKLRDAGGGSQGEKREWEVGYKGNYDEVDDGHRSLKW